MGTDDIFKKRKQDRKKRQIEMKTPKPNSYLIVAEGEKTEPLYFQGIVDKIIEKVGGNITVYPIPTIDIHGEGCSTNSLIDKTEEIVNKAKIIYEKIWVIFDKDDFEDFDSAIDRALKNGYHVGWSNECFEYWLYLHFFYSDSSLHRDNWFDKVDDIFKKYGLGDGKYKKNEARIFDLLNNAGSVKSAIGYAKNRMKEFNQSGRKPSEFNPGTTVHILVEELLKYLED